MYITVSTLTRKGPTLTLPTRCAPEIPGIYISTVKELHLEFIVVKEPQLPMFKVTYRDYNSIYNYV